VHSYREQGILSIKGRDGIYRSHTLPSSWTNRAAFKSINIIYIGAESDSAAATSFHKELFQCLTDEPESRGYSTKIHEVSSAPGYIERLHLIAESSGCEGCIFVRLTALEQLRPFELNQIPYTCLYPESPEEPKSNAVLLPQDRVVESQFKHLYGLGHRRIAFLHNIDPCVYRRGRSMQRDAFYRLALDYNLPIDSSMIQYAGISEESQKQGVMRVLGNIDKRPTAIICNDLHLPVTYACANELGLIIGKDLSVVGTNDGPEATQVTPHATTLRIPRQNAAKLAIDMLELLYDVPDARTPNQEVQVRLIKRKSTCSIGA
jgi:DNA-binding LacI/PurR family transcriptional regulator